MAEAKVDIAEIRRQKVGKAKVQAYGGDPLKAPKK